MRREIYRQGEKYAADSINLGENQEPVFVHLHAREPHPNRRGNRLRNRTVPSSRRFGDGAPDEKADEELLVACYAILFPNPKK